MKKILIVLLAMIIAYFFIACPTPTDSGDGGDSGNDPISGPFTEDFETGDLSLYYWVTEGDYPPAVIQGDNATHFAHDGSGGNQLDGYALEMDIDMDNGAGLNKTAWFAAQFDVETETDLSFWAYTSMDNDDLFAVYLDGLDGDEVINTKTVLWEQQTITLPVGNYSVIWYYKELLDNTNGFAKLWIDDIEVGSGASMIDPLGKITTLVDGQAPDSNGDHEVTVSQDTGSIVSVDVSLLNMGIAPIDLTGDPLVDGDSGGDPITLYNPTESTIGIEGNVGFYIEVDTTTGNSPLTIDLSIPNNTDTDPYEFTITVNIVNEILIDDFSAYTYGNPPAGDWTSGYDTGSTFTYGPVIAVPFGGDNQDPAQYHLSFDDFMLDANNGYKWATITFNAPGSGNISFDFVQDANGTLDQFELYYDETNMDTPTTTPVWTNTIDTNYNGSQTTNPIPITSGSHTLTWRWYKASGDGNDYNIDIDNIYFNGN